MILMDLNLKFKWNVITDLVITKMSKWFDIANTIEYSAFCDDIEA